MALYTTIDKKKISKENISDLKLFPFYLNDFYTLAKDNSIYDSKSALIQNANYLKLLNKDLLHILKLPAHIFWSHALYDKDFKRLLDTFLRGSSEPPCFPTSSLVLRLAKMAKIYKNFFFCFLRLAAKTGQNGEPLLTTSCHGEMLYRILDIPKLFDICAIYGASNPSLVSRILYACFDSNMSFSSDLQNSLILTNSFVRKKYLRKDLNFSENDYFLIFDIFSCFNTFIDLYPPGLNVFKNSSFFGISIRIINSFERQKSANKLKNDIISALCKLFIKFCEFFYIDKKMDSHLELFDFLTNCFGDYFSENKQKTPFLLKLIKNTGFRKKVLASCKKLPSKKLILLGHLFESNNISESLSDLSEEQNENLRLFCSVFPNFTRRNALVCLKHFDWNYEKAVNQVLDKGAENFLQKFCVASVKGCLTGVVLNKDIEALKRSAFEKDNCSRKFDYEDELEDDFQPYSFGVANDLTLDEAIN